MQSFDAVCIEKFDHYVGRDSVVIIYQQHFRLTLYIKVRKKKENKRVLW